MCDTETVTQMELAHRSLKASSYYWEFLKRFGAVCFRTWRQEIAGAFAVTLITYILTNQEKDAWQIASTALEANLIWFSAFVFVHLIRTPYLLHREHLRPDLGGERVVRRIFGLIGAVLLLAIFAAASYRVIRPWLFQEL
jgi:DMSO/TMAO reductase YedYZ heme-binding membrane subunit